MDVGRVIKGLECCDALHNGGEVKCANNCPYWLGYDGEINNNCRGSLINDALALLKAQEPVEPTIGGDADGPCGNWWYQCGKCKEAIDYRDKYCRNCGRAVKWE